MTIDERYRPRSVAAVSHSSLAGQRSKTRFEVALLSTVSAGVSLALAPLAQAQGEEPAQELEQVVVTGSRVVRDGFQSPTPTTIVGIEEMQAAAPTNLADFVNELPSVAGSTRPQNSQTSISSGAAGVNTMNLRGIGNNRTLTLLDGQRSVPSLLTGAVDVNNFPQSLISRVDIVTGGASAVYGSDAIAGVVNYILDKDFTGMKGSVDTSATTEHGDNRTWKGSITAGAPFAGDRGHFLFAAELARKDGILHSDRDWNRDGWGQMLNPNYTPDNGEPFRLIVPHVGLSTATPGGIITSGPLRGIAFGEGGTPYNFNYGDIVSDPYMQGGDWRAVGRRHVPSLDPEVNRRSIFTRVSFDVTSDLHVYAQGQWASTKINNICCSAWGIGNITVPVDNAFMPESVRSQMIDLGLDSITMGSTYDDLPGPGSRNTRSTNRFVVGANGYFSLFDSDWSWNAYYQRGVTHADILGTDMWDNQRRAWAFDPVLDPDTGIAVCRATLEGVSGAEDCVPFNVFGTNVNSPAAIEYLGLHGTGRGRVGPWMIQRLTQDVAAVSVSGEPLSWRAGPISLAAGAEHRKEKVTGESDLISQTTRWFAGNYLATKGSYHVSEAFVETLVPVISDSRWAESLDISAAVRLTDYSASGRVSTWKVGAMYSPTEGTTFRLTSSRDIRAPSLQDLYQAGTANTNNVRDPFNGNITTQYLAVRTGNLELSPEQADTIGVGIVYQPSFIPGLSASVDYYEIDIKDALGQPGPQTIVDRCFDGNQQYCNAITRDADGNLITQINIVPFNIAEQKHRGVDYELSYRLPMEKFNDSWIGDLAFRAMATNYLEAYENNGIDVPTDTAGQNMTDGPPSWLYRATVSHTTERYSATLIGRGVSSGTFDNSYIECTSNCPASTPEHNTINDNRVAGAFYLDANLTYQLQPRSDSEMEIFLSLRNLTDKEPPIRAAGPGGVVFTSAPTDLGLFDGVGRTLRLGFRFRM